MRPLVNFFKKLAAADFFASFKDPAIPEIGL
jgi:hypothetical protein